MSATWRAAPCLRPRTSLAAPRPYSTPPARSGRGGRRTRQRGSGTPEIHRARVGGVPLALSILIQPDWLGEAIRLSTDQERFQLAAPDVGAAVRLPEGPALEAALRRLAVAETSATVMVNNPLYRLRGVDLSPRRLEATVTL